ncbi:MAG: hypothetical protein AAGI30_05300 [Planctomycetota bacterium]
MPTEHDPKPNPADPMNEAEAECEALEHGVRYLLASYHGILHLNGPDNSAEVRFIRAPEDGRLIMACPVASFFAEEIVLFVPDEADDAMKLLLSGEQIEESALTDRCQAYHGDPEHVRWGAFWIDSAKHGPWVFDGDAMMTPNPFAGEETTLLRELNADRAALGDLARREHTVDAAEGVAVGLDPLGLDIRLRFGPTRIAFAERAPSLARAGEMIRAMLS